MKRQRKYGLVARLAGLWLLVMGSVAAAKGLAGTEQHDDGQQRDGCDKGAEYATSERHWLLRRNRATI